MDNKKQYCEIVRYGYENTLTDTYKLYCILKLEYPNIEFIVTFNNLNNGFNVVALTEQTIYA